jgi:hypothetical protein
VRYSAMLSVLQLDRYRAHRVGRGSLIVLRDLGLGCLKSHVTLQSNVSLPTHLCERHPVSSYSPLLRSLHLAA